MRIVDRATFLALPAGTVYAKWSPLIIGEICIKVGNCQGFDDWVYQSLDMLDGDSPVDSLEALESGKEVAVDMDYTERDGLYEPDQRFAVWSPDDVDALIKRLYQAQASAHGEWLRARELRRIEETRQTMLQLEASPEWAALHAKNIERMRKEVAEHDAKAAKAQQ